MLLLVLFACENDCKKIEKGTHQAIDVMLKVGTKSGFKANGYTHCKVQEVDSVLRIGQVTYFNKDSLTFLPLVHSSPQSTFIFSGDTVVAETLVVFDYNSRIEYSTECKYTFKIDQPKIKSYTFDSCIVLKYDTVSETLKIELYK
ncbi:MAG TPA: hypothetical protein PLI68_11930 [Bacteroidia bacterium]|nr:hypothetical protein [Bacteroidia bacterium]